MTKIEASKVLGGAPAVLVTPAVARQRHAGVGDEWPLSAQTCRYPAGQRMRKIAPHRTLARLGMKGGMGWIEALRPGSLGRHGCADTRRSQGRVGMAELDPERSFILALPDRSRSYGGAC